MKKMIATIIAVCCLTQTAFAGFMEKIYTPVSQDENGITKRGAVYLCLELMNYDISSYSGEDLLLIAKDMGMIDAVDGADTELIGTHFMKILLVSMGYSEYARVQGGFPAGYFAAAKTAGLNISLFTNQVIGRQEV